MSRSVRERVRAAARYALPHGVAQQRQRRRLAEKARREAAARKERLARAAEASTDGAAVTYSYEDSTAFLVGERRLNPEHVKYGSIPSKSMTVIGDVLRAELPCDRPLVGLHVGNFVGVSLAFLTHALTEAQAGSVVISVDPGLTHRGIERPQEHALALLDRYGLGSSHLFLQGYSLGRNLGNDGGVETSEADLFSDLAASHAPHAVLDSLVKIDVRFDVALMDGNHEGAYLQAEIERVHQLLRPGGVLVLDDVEPDGIWTEVWEVFERTQHDSAFEQLNADGRVALFRRT